MKLGSTLALGRLVCGIAAGVALLGCGNVDPGKQQPTGGSAGEPAAGGDGSGATGASGGSGATDAGGAGNAASGGEGNAGAPDMPPAGSLLPWAVGNSWTYQVTDGTDVTFKTTTIGDEEPIGGTGPNAKLSAFHVTTAKGANEMDHTESWQAPDPESPERILRYREQSFNAMTGDLELEEHWKPAKLHVDGSAAHTVTGASWLETYYETKSPVGFPQTTHQERERWTVVSDDETLEVPAGSFEHVVHFMKAGSALKEYWYARGVGKLKETGAQTEELTEYSLEAQP